MSRRPITFTQPLLTVLPRSSSSSDNNKNRDGNATSTVDIPTSTPNESTKTLLVPTTVSSLSSSSSPPPPEIEAKGNNNTTRLQQISETLEEITGAHEIAALKEKVSTASQTLEQATQQLQTLRLQLDEETAAHQALTAEHADMMTRRATWTDTDVQKFAQCTAAEGRARTAVDTTRTALSQAEEDWQSAQNAYLDAVRQRYHEEQVWHDKWRVMGTYWTWMLIGLNSVVFVVGQALLYRRETLRMQILQDMIRPLTTAAEFENASRMLPQEQDDDIDSEKKGGNDNPRGISNAARTKEEIDSPTPPQQHEQQDSSAPTTMQNEQIAWQKQFGHWTKSTSRLLGQSIRLVRSSSVAVTDACRTTTSLWVGQPARHVATQVSLLAKERNLHWPSALVGATTAGLVAKTAWLLTLGRNPR